MEMLKTRRLATTFGRFLTVGLLGTGVNLAALALLAGLGVPTLLASLAATEIAIIHNFLWNDAWTFKNGPAQAAFKADRKWHRFSRFQLISLFTAFLSLVLFGLFHLTFGWHYLLAQFVAIGVITVLNFVSNTYLTWGRAEGSSLSV